IFRNTPAEIPLLVIYRNTPSIIIGRNQNPWKEVNQAALRSTGVPFVRRRSGGGTVYHDLGNINYSIMIPRTMFERRPNAELVARAIQTLNIPAEVNERNDIVVEGFKISYKIVNKRAYHHGTMLVDAQLHQLGDLLRNTKNTLVTKGVESVRSPVRNLRHWNSEVTTDKFSTAVVNEFRQVYGGTEQARNIDESLMDHIPGIKSIFEELQTWQWSHGQTPEFTHALQTSFSWGDLSAHISSKHGVITSIMLTSSSPDSVAAQACQALSEDLQGQRYGILDGAISISADSEEDAIKDEILAWLREEM
ncbi:Biotin/lipoate A/B protein ligase, partial [Tulasnella sp. 418]